MATLPMDIIRKDLVIPRLLMYVSRDSTKCKATLSY